MKELVHPHAGSMNPADGCTRVRRLGRPPKVPFNAEVLLDNGRLSQMRDYLKLEADCPLTSGSPNPLKADKELLRKMLLRYEEIFGSKPTEAILVKQGLYGMASALRFHGGTNIVMDQAAKSRGYGVKARPPRKEEPEPAEPVPREKMESVGLEMICLGSAEPRLGELDQRLVVQFINSNLQNVRQYERLEGRHPTPHLMVRFALSSRGPEIPVGKGKCDTLLFRKKDVPALLFVARLEIGSAATVKSAISELSSELNSLGGSAPSDWFVVKLWAARRFWDTHLNSYGKGVSKEDVDALHLMLNRPAATAIFGSTKVEC